MVETVQLPGILGPACLLAPWKPHASMKLLKTWAKTMAKVVDLEVNVIDRNKTIDIENVNTMVTIERSNKANSADVNINNKVCNSPSSTTATTNKTGTLYVHLNQQTLLSVVLYSIALPFYKIVMNIEFALIPFIGWYPALLGGTTIIRQYPTMAKESLKKVVENLKKGETYCISIEGKRCESNGMLSPYKKGPIILALESQCDIIPFLTMGEFNVWPYGTWTLVPGKKIDIILLPKISTKGLTLEHRNELVQRLRRLAETEISLWNSTAKQ